MNIVVVGAGAWGTAFALHLSRLGHTVTLAPRRFEQALTLASTRENADYLPGHVLPRSLQLGHELPPLLMEAELVLLACPSQSLRDTCLRLQAARGLATQLKLVVSLAKGLELGTHLRPTEVMAATLPGLAVGALSGPTNAAEVASGRPCAMVLAAAGADEPLLAAMQAALSGPTLRVYRGDDVAGVEFGGCLKNVYAIAAGCGDGLRLGDNAKAALLTRALAEMVRVGVALGARAETFYGLGGFGDLVATCTGAWSRNRTFGQRLGEGQSAESLLAASKSVVEGYRTTRSFFELVRERGIDAPILTETHAILYAGKPPAEALAALMGRELKRE
ncbi:MAG: NAD(P)-dependent glycerol-3-phosphate dehydrogenase [Opitutaceae bacterium]|jgi:glycerol-3-phosphate dehydrogenase (NAD(P)+)|nr:NAD(P)-dependent glycerol-3-phosphate dehydrogenase [Opitutaceae bacterium]